MPRSIDRLHSKPHPATGSLAFVAALLFVAPLAGADPPAHEISLELRPYRVQIDLAYASAPDFDGASGALVQSDFGDCLERVAGSLWQTSIRANAGIRLAGVDPLQRLRPEDLERPALAADLDKLYLLSVEPAGAGIRIAGREWDTATSQLGAMQIVTLPDRRETAHCLMKLLQSLFRPVATIEQSKGGPLRLRARGGALAPHDESWQALREGMLFEAYYRYLNQEHAVERIQQIPWTYLTAGRVEQGVADGTVTSGLRAALSTRRRRVEVVALGVSRQVDSTRLTLVTRPPTRRPLGGVEVELAADSQPSDAPSTPPAEGAGSGRFVTDRKGQVLLRAAADATKPMWLFVRNGQNLLARIPFVPGLHADELLELPDDTLRLEVEGHVAQLQSELVDTVARRAVLATLARQRAKAREWPDVDEFMRQLAAGPKAAVFVADLSGIRVHGLQAARAQKDRATELRVRRLCDDMAKLISDYLEEDKLRELRDEIDELKKIAEEDDAAENALKSGQPPAKGRRDQPTRKSGANPPEAVPPAKTPPAGAAF